MDYLKHLTETIKKELDIDLTVENSRKRHVVDARRIYCDLAKEFGYYTFDDIGKHINKNHATVIHLTKTSKDLIKFDKEYKKKYDFIFEQIEKLPVKIHLESAYKYHLQKVRFYKQKLNEL